MISTELWKSQRVITELGCGSGVVALDPDSFQKHRHCLCHSNQAWEDTVLQDLTLTYPCPGFSILPALGTSLTLWRSLAKEQDRA